MLKDNIWRLPETTRSLWSSESLTTWTELFWWKPKKLRTEAVCLHGRRWQPEYIWTMRWSTWNVVSYWKIELFYCKNLFRNLDKACPCKPWIKPKGARKVVHKYLLLNICCCYSTVCYLAHCWDIWLEGLCLPPYTIFSPRLAGVGKSVEEVGWGRIEMGKGQNGVLGWAEWCRRERIWKCQHHWYPNPQTVAWVQANVQ